MFVMRNGHSHGWSIRSRVHDRPIGLGLRRVLGVPDTSAILIIAWRRMKRRHEHPALRGNLSALSGEISMNKSAPPVSLAGYRPLATLWSQAGAPSFPGSANGVVRLA